MTSGVSVAERDALTLRLPPTSAAARDGRRFVVSALLHWGLDGLTDVAALLTSELMTNAVLHAGTEVTLTVRRDALGVQVAVRDGSPQLPRQSAQAGLGTTGRGLQLVEALADGWSVEANGTGKTVRFRLRSGGGAPAARRGGRP